MSDLVSVMRNLRRMPPLPEVAHRILQIVKDPNYSTDSLVAVVRTDPSLTAQILRLCNSSAYGLQTEVNCVSDAVAYLGTRNLVKLVVVTCTASYFGNVDGGYFAKPGEIWRHSVACGVTCQLLAERSGTDLSATAFTAGILHNIGKVALAQVLEQDPDRMRQITVNESDDFLTVERRLAGLDHATAGGIVAESWNLPGDLRRAIRNHHEPSQVRSDGDLTALVHIADLMVLQLGIGIGADGLNYPVCSEAMDRLHLTDQDLDVVRIEVLDELKRSEDLVNLCSRVSR